MSSNDYIEIRRDGKEYVISHLDMETGNGREIKRKKGLKMAIEWAQSYEREFFVEYGLHFKDI